MSLSSTRSGSDRRRRTSPLRGDARTIRAGRPRPGPGSTCHEERHRQARGEPRSDGRLPPEQARRRDLGERHGSLSRTVVRHDVRRAGGEPRRRRRHQPFRRSRNPDDGLPRLVPPGHSEPSRRVASPRKPLRGGAAGERSMAGRAHRGSQHRQRVQAHLLPDDAQVPARRAPALRRNGARRSAGRLGQLAAPPWAAPSRFGQRRHACPAPSGRERRRRSGLDSRLRHRCEIRSAPKPHRGDANHRDGRGLDRALRAGGRAAPRLLRRGRRRPARCGHPPASVRMVAGLEPGNRHVLMGNACTTAAAARWRRR